MNMYYIRMDRHSLIKPRATPILLFEQSTETSLLYSPYFINDIPINHDCYYQKFDDLFFKYNYYSFTQCLQKEYTKAYKCIPRSFISRIFSNIEKYELTEYIFCKHNPNLTRQFKQLLSRACDHLPKMPCLYEMVIYEIKKIKQNIYISMRMSSYIIVAEL